MDMFSGKTKNKVLKKFFAAAWGPHRELPEVAPKSFKELWDDRREVKK
jgi:L-lactate dehydrogenase complex protein LldF